TAVAKMVALFGTWFVAVFCACASTLALAAAIDPPSVFLFKASHSLVAGEVVLTTAEGTLELRVRETLHGTAPNSRFLRVRTSPAWLADFDRGHSVVVGYTRYRRSATRPRTLELRPGGPVVLVSVGLEPALFRDTPALRARLARARDGAHLRSRKYFEEVTGGLESADPQLQNYYAAELVLRETLQVAMNAGDRAWLARFVGDDLSHPSARAMLLAMSAAHPERFGARWPQGAAAAMLAQIDVAASDAPLSLLPNLVRVAFDVLDRADQKIALGSAERWLVSSHTGLVEAALLAIRRTAPEREREIATRALANDRVQPAVRDFVRDHLRRLDIMQSAIERERADGDSR
ncbi:MAG: hypothetical protein ABIP49_10995, partial [Lysobacterales bacterium]